MTGQVTAYVSQVVTPDHVTGQVTFPRSCAGKSSCYEGRFVTISTKMRNQDPHLPGFRDSLRPIRKLMLVGMVILQFRMEYKNACRSPIVLRRARNGCRDLILPFLPGHYRTERIRAKPHFYNPDRSFLSPVSFHVRAQKWPPGTTRMTFVR